MDKLSNLVAGQKFSFNQDSQHYIKLNNWSSTISPYKYCFINSNYTLCGTNDDDYVYIH